MNEKFEPLSIDEVIERNNGMIELTKRALEKADTQLTKNAVQAMLDFQQSVNYHLCNHKQLTFLNANHE